MAGLAGIIFWICIAAIPITAILAGTYNERKKNELEAGVGKADGSTKLVLEEMKKENLLLKERVENLENIITQLDEDLLLLNTVKENPSDKVKRLIEKIDKKREE